MHSSRAAVTTVSALAAVALTGAATVPVATATSQKASDEPAAVATADGPVTHEENDRVPEGASWTQHYFPSSDGSDVELHADVRLPEGLEKGERVPVILSAGSYFGHSGEISEEGHAHTGPSDRFGDLVEGIDLFDRGYALVLVDTRGYGGSTGCMDFAGPGEQADVAAAIDWAADQSWSTGAVGMYGKSYDAVTGLIGNDLDQDALKAVVAQEPIWDMYDRVRSNGVPRQEGIIAPNTYNTIAQLPQMADDDERYVKNSRYELAHPECLAANTLNNLSGTTCGATTAPRTARGRWGARAGSTRSTPSTTSTSRAPGRRRRARRSRSRTAPAPGAPRTRGRPRTGPRGSRSAAARTWTTAARTRSRTALGRAS